MFSITVKSCSNSAAEQTLQNSVADNNRHFCFFLSPGPVGLWGFDGFWLGLGIFRLQVGQAWFEPADFVLIWSPGWCACSHLGPVLLSDSRSSRGRTTQHRTHLESCSQATSTNMPLVKSNITGVGEGIYSLPQWEALQRDNGKYY